MRLINTLLIALLLAALTVSSATAQSQDIETRIATLELRVQTLERHIAVVEYRGYRRYWKLLDRPGGGIQLMGNAVGGWSNVLTYPAENLAAYDAHYSTTIHVTRRTSQCQ